MPILIILNIKNGKIKCENVEDRFLETYITVNNHISYTCTNIQVYLNKFAIVA